MLHLLPRLLQPSEIAFKRGSLVRLKYLKGHRAVVFCGSSSLKKSGHLDKLISFLRSAKIELLSVINVVEEPFFEEVQGYAKTLSSLRPDWIIACGGGSVLDSAKLSWALYEHPSLSLSQLTKPHSLPPLRSLAKFVAIPTTSGSGSETSSVAAVKNRELKRKNLIISSEFIPDLAILDANLTISLPCTTTVYTTLDAFTHAVEAFCSTLRHPLSNQYAISCAKMIKENASLTISNPADIEAREKLQYASMLGGIAQNLASVGATHALSHALSSDDIPHGLGNAIFLPSVLRFNAKTSLLPKEFSQEIGFSSLDHLIEWIHHLLDQAGLSNRWGGYINAKSSPLIELSKAAYEDICLKTNPAKMDLSALQAILEETR